MTTRFHRILNYVLMIVVLLGSSIWLTSWALQPEAVGEAAAPDPRTHPDAVIQVYGANVWGWRGNFAIHTWVATKARDASSYRIYQVIGWRLRRGRPVVSVTDGDPAKPWFGSPALLLHDIRGEKADLLIDRIDTAVDLYPFASAYKMWPGPNSNSFVAWIGLQVPELELSLPAKAIGQAWMKSEYPALIAAPDQGL